MASLSVIRDATVPLDTSNWTQVQHKKSNSSSKSKEQLEKLRSAMKSTKVTIIIRIPNDAADDFSVAEVHYATLKELSKQDSNMVVMDNKGTTQINYHKDISQDKYKDLFKPREKTLNNGAAQVSVAHHILSNIENFNKTLMIPFLKKNKVFIYFNQKDGLEHFAAIGVMFGPHPELTWRQDIVEKIEKTMKADITDEDCEELKTTRQHPKIVISMVPQQISNPKHAKTTSIALEIRVPADHEKTYLNILDRLNERASTLDEGEVDITLDDRLGTFFPYYAKRSRPKLFDSLMKKQNSDMNSISAIPIFGMTPSAANYEVAGKSGEVKTVWEWIAYNEDIRKVDKTASSQELGKYMLQVNRDMKEEVEEYLDELFDNIPELDGQPASFRRPQRGGNAFKKKRVTSISNYLDKLEERVNLDLSMYDEESLASTPPPRMRRPTITYAQAAKKLAFQDDANKNSSTHDNSNTTTSTSLSTLTQDSLNEAMEQIRKETAESIEKLRQELQTDALSMENNIATAVINALKSPQAISMDTDNSDEMSNQSTAYDTVATMKTLEEKFDSLSTMVQMLAERMSEIVENQEHNQNKRNRPVESPTKQILKSPSARQSAQSPPAKLQRAMAPKPPNTPPPHGIPSKEGTREEK
jgi:translation elongation factor P/translation initiation factor 5A